MSNSGKVWLTSLVFFAATLRINGLFANTLHADEALFASWARLIAVGRDPLLVSQIVDKPPLLFYLQALFFPIFGPADWAARIPNLIASLFLVPVTGILAWRLFRNEAVVLLSAAFVAFSPLAIQFSATAFIDPLLTFLLTTSLALIVAQTSGRINNRAFDSRAGDNAVGGRLRRGFSVRSNVLAGVFFGLALLAKYQAWLFLPLIVGLAIFNGWRWREWRYWLLGAIPFVVLLFLWDLIRGKGFSLLDAQLTSYGGLRMTWSWELWSRLEAWGQQWSYMLDSPVLLFALILAIPLFFAVLIYHQDRSTAVDQVLVVFIIWYFVIHWFIAVPTWDRYVLPIVPIVGLALGRFVWRIFDFLTPALPMTARQRSMAMKLVWLTPIVLLTLQAPSVLAAYKGQLPIGGQPAADGGASQIAEVLVGEPYGTVLYDHWSSWQWRFHLFDGRIYVSWFASPDALVEDLVVFANDDHSRFLTLPDSPVAEPALRAVRDAGFRLEVVDQTHGSLSQPGMILYRIMASGLG